MQLTNFSLQPQIMQITCKCLTLQDTVCSMSKDLCPSFEKRRKKSIFVLDLSYVTAKKFTTCSKLQAHSLAACLSAASKAVCKRNEHFLTFCMHLLSCLWGKQQEFFGGIVPSVLILAETSAEDWCTVVPSEVANGDVLSPLLRHNTARRVEAEGRETSLLHAEITVADG